MTNKRCLYCNEIFIPDRKSKGLFCCHNHANKARCGQPRSEETKKRQSQAMKEYYLKHPEKITRGKKLSEAVGKSTKGKFKKDPQSIEELSNRTISKIIRRLNIGCSRCGWNEAIGDIHHIYGKKIENANHHTNLTYLCPNCHRLFHCKKIGPNDVINLEVFIGDRWKEYYYG